MAVGLEGLGGLVLETILSKLEPVVVSAVACVSTKLRAAASDDALWRHFCARDLGIDAPLDPDGNACHSFKEAYKIWFQSFVMYPLPLVKRAKQCWVSIKSWMAVNYPEAYDTLRKGATEAEIKRAEESLGVKLPIPTRVMFRFCDGQQTMSEDPSEGKRLASLGIIGGYEFYNHYVNVHLLPLKQIVAYTKIFSRRLGFPTRSKCIILAASYYTGKYFFLNCANGQLYVGTKNLMTDGEMLPCVPQELINPVFDANNHVPQDALLLWLEEHSRRLHSGVIHLRGSRSFRSISLYPELPPSCSIAVTNGVQVRASAVFVPEASDLNGGEEKYYYSYSIRMSLLPEGCMLDGTYFSSCQLHSRHWLICCKDAVVSNVHGEAVIGKFPLLFPGKEEFVYESCTPLPGAPGSVEGSFTFVPGRLRKPEGKQFDVKVAPFILEEPGLQRILKKAGDVLNFSDIVLGNMTLSIVYESISEVIHEAEWNEDSPLSSRFDTSPLTQCSIPPKWRSFGCYGGPDLCSSRVSALFSAFPGKVPLLELSIDRRRLVSTDFCCISFLLGFLRL